MKKIVFSKYEALGNDFIIIDESQDNRDKKEPSTSYSLRRTLCDRKFGIGGDGVITLLPPISDTGLVFMHVTNADGSVPENCGNGLRCVARWLRDNGRISNHQTFFIDTYSGSKRATVNEESVSVELGLARVDLAVNALEIVERTQHFARKFGVEEPKPIAFVDVGNPHLILETPHIELAQVELGPSLEKLSLFLRGANVSFVHQEASDAIALRVWERGAGETLSCGTGACAAVVAGISKKLLDSPVRVQTRGGALTISWAGGDNAVWMKGPAESVYDGTIEI